MLSQKLKQRCCRGMVMASPPRIGSGDHLALVARDPNHHRQTAVIKNLDNRVVPLEGSARRPNQNVGSQHLTLYPSTWSSVFLNHAILTAYASVSSSGLSSTRQGRSDVLGPYMCRVLREGSISNPQCPVGPPASPSCINLNKIQAIFTHDNLLLLKGSKASIKYA